MLALPLPLCIRSGISWSLKADVICHGWCGIPSSTMLQAPMGRNGEKTTKGIYLAVLCVSFVLLKHCAIWTSHFIEKEKQLRALFL